MPVAQTLCRRTDERSCWETVGRWLDQCQCGHDQCRSYSRHENWLPSRLVDVGSQADEFVRVVSTAGTLDPTKTSYLALSHCWGTKSFETLNQDTQKDFDSGIHHSRLVPNFLDAVQATRYLGFRYIWIDSLCILQGSTDDWRRESPLMNMVYTNAVLTLAASDSVDAYGGLFRERDPALRMPHKIEIPYIDEETGKLTHRQAYILTAKEIWNQQVEQAPLNSRAWVLQERVLSPRTLYFGRDHLFWECITLSTSDVFPDGSPFPLTNSPKSLFRCQDRDSSRGGKEVASTIWSDAIRYQASDIPIQGYHLWNIPDGLSVLEGSFARNYKPWHGLVERYTKCQVTNANDKLVAISGLAKEVSKQVSDQYIAGLWLKNLLRDLLWARYSSEAGANPSQSRRAPSWSWASLDVSIVYFYAERENLYNTCIEILTVGVKPISNSELTGQIRDAFIRVRCYLLDFPEFVKNNYKGGCEFHDDIGRPSAKLQFDNTDWREVSFLPFGLVGGFGGTSPEQPWLIGLVVRRKETDEDLEVYERIGLVCFYPGVWLTTAGARGREVKITHAAKGHEFDTLPETSGIKTHREAIFAGNPHDRCSVPPYDRENDDYEEYAKKFGHWKYFDRTSPRVEVILK